MEIQSTNPTLLSRVKDPADHAAWREFDTRYRDLILRYCRRRGVQPSDAEDVRQMVMLNLARGLRNFEYQPEKGRFRDYLGRSVQNAIHRTFRRPRPEVNGLGTSVLGDIAVDGSSGPDDEWEAEWMKHHYRMALETVRSTADPRSVEVFEHLLAGEATAEVAERFAMSTEAVHKVKQRIRDRLKRTIERQVLDEESPGGRAGA